MEIFNYKGVDISGVLDRIPDAERNALPFGCVKLDTKGTILEYNMAEAAISGVSARDAIGKNFFLDLAVCTQRPEFYGLFRQAMDGPGFINQIFNYEFQNAAYAAVHEPVKVRVHMFSSKSHVGEKVVWLLVKRMDAQTRPEVIDVTQASASSKGSAIGSATTVPPASIPGRKADDGSIFIDMA